MWKTIVVQLTFLLFLPCGAAFTVVPSPQISRLLRGCGRSKQLAVSKTRDDIDIIEKYSAATIAGDATSRAINPATIALAFAALGLFGKTTWDIQNTMIDGMANEATSCAALKALQPPVEGAPDDVIIQYKAAENMCLLWSEGEFFKENEFLSKVLMWTHVFPFLLIPFTMRLVSERAEAIQRDHKQFNPFIMQLGLATVCFALAQEFGWHVTSNWFYVNNYHVLNFGFYFFLISAFALWADGFKSNWFWNIVMGGILLWATNDYPTGAAADLVSLGGDANSGKIPLYVGLTVTFLVLSIRGEEIFGKAMYWVPFFSVGVNLFFIFLLDGVSNPVWNGETFDGMEPLNYIYHICHDLLGTEMGVIIFAYLLYKYDQDVAGSLKSAK